jgi:SAM-dependent methyltransferase
MADRFIDKFSERAAGYCRARPTYPPQLFAALAALAPGRDLAWDCGTGNGQAARALAAHFAAVHASDPSADQIAQAEPTDRVTYHVERAENGSLADGTADLVVAAQALHWFDLDLFYGQCARVLKPGGILAAFG